LVRGKALNALVAAARDSSFARDSHEGQVPSAQAPPNPEELAEVVLAEFEDLRRERYGRSGLVPIHEVRRRIADRFGPATARHDVLDEVVLDLWRQQRIRL